jgi:hypothetical protein
MSCQLHYIMDIEMDGKVTKYIRGAISGIFGKSRSFLYPEERLYADKSLNVDHPTVFALRALQYADTAAKYCNRDMVGKCATKLEKIEGKLKDSKSAGKLSVELNDLSKELSRVRICIQYVKAAATTMRSHAIEESERNLKVVFDSFYGLDGFEDGDEFKRNILKDLRTSEIGLDTLYSITSLEKTCEQRLLEVEFIQQRADNALMVVSLIFKNKPDSLLITPLQVSNLLARQEIDWQHNMETSQKTIAVVTMFFLPATFFAVRI